MGGAGHPDKSRGLLRQGDGANTEIRYLFVEREKASHSVVMLCRVLAVSASGYYAWRKREPSPRARQDAELTERIVEIHEQSGQTSPRGYPAPRIHAELADRRVRCGRKRVARQMQTAGIAGCHRGRH